MINQIFLSLDDAGVLAQDWSLSHPQDPVDRLRVKALQHKILKEMARHDPLWLKNHIDTFIQRNIGIWQVGLGKATAKVAQWFIRNQIMSCTNAQKSAFKAAGINIDFIKTRWSVPFRSGYIAPSVAEIIPKMVKDNAALITKISLSDVSRIADVITQGLTEGDDLPKLRRTLAETDGFDAKRVERVVTDQTNKVFNQIKINNSKDLGVSYGIWKHVPGKYTSRPTHVAMDGKKFDLSVGLYDSDIGKNVLPGECINCFCVYRDALPDWLTAGTKQAKT